MPQFGHILFPVDFSERSQAAAPYVLSLARRYNSHITLFHAIEPLPPLYAGMNTVYPETVDYAAMEADVRNRLREFANCELPKTNTTCHAVMGDPARAITGFADANHVDLIAIATHGYGIFRRALLGSVTAKVLHDSSIPVWTAAHAPEPSHRAHPQPRRILCAIDLKEESRRVLDFAIAIAGDAGATVELVHLAPEGELNAAEADVRMNEFTAEIARKGVVQVESATGPEIQTTLAGGSVASVVRDVAVRKRVDLVLIGRGSIQAGAFSRLRANAYDIVRESPCPVISI